MDPRLQELAQCVGKALAHQWLAHRQDGGATPSTNNNEMQHKSAGKRPHRHRSCPKVTRLSNKSDPAT